MAVIEKDNMMVQDGRFTPVTPGEVLVNGEADLDELAGRVYPGTVAYTANQAQRWQLGPDGVWARYPAAVYPQADWNTTDPSSNRYIRNKPAIGAGTGTNAIQEGNDTTASGSQSHAEGNGTTASGAQSHAEGSRTEASGEVGCHAEGNMTKATGTPAAHAEGQSTTASGVQSHAEGNGTTASGPQSHSEGYGTTASGVQSHAEGNVTKAIGSPAAHAEGNGTTASGVQSHAEGYCTTASGAQSHAEGNGTTANHASQHVFGECNIADSSAEAAIKRGVYVEIVGNGTSNAPSNARTLDWSGNEWLAGNLTAAGGSITIGTTIITEAQLQALLALLN